MYSVKITETLSRIIPLEVPDPDEALDIVINRYKNEDIILGAEDFVDVDIAILDLMDEESETELKFILTALRKSDKMRLHLIDRGIESDNSKFVVCWNYDSESGTWDWGTYCGNIKNALTIFTQKCEEHGFDAVNKGYVEKPN